MSSYGRQTLDGAARNIQVSADGKPLAKLAGGTIDWATVTAVSADTTLEDGTVIKNGKKYLRYGQVVTLIGVAEVQTWTWTGGATGGSAVLTLPAAGEEAAESTAALAYNASAAVVQAAVEALNRIGPGRVSVARTGAGSDGDPYIYTATFDRELGNVPAFTATHTFTGGTTPTVTIATTTSGEASGGYFGPYDASASDGRATIARNAAYILNKTVTEEDIASDHPELIYGGLLWKQRIIATNGTHTLAAGPTFTELQTAFPLIHFAT